MDRRLTEDLYIIWSQLSVRLQPVGYSFKCSDKNHYSYYMQYSKMTASPSPHPPHTHIFIV